MNARTRLRDLRGGPAARSWYRINASTDAAVPEVFIYDEIDSSGVSAEQFVRDLAALDGPEIVVRINSPGGNVFDGLAIMHSIAGHDAMVTTVVDGLAASAASFIALAGDEVVMRPGAELMIHDAWGLAVGTAEDLRALAEQLDRTSSTLADIYAAKAGGAAGEWRDLMRAETWYSANEAVTAGLADRVEAPRKDTTAAGTGKARVFDLSVFNYHGRGAAPAPRLHRRPFARAEVTRKEGPMSTLMEGLRERFGLPDDADEATILAAVTAELDSTTAPAEDAAPDAPAEPTLQQIAASAKRLNLRLVDATQYEQLAAQAAQGAQAFARQQAQHRDTVLADAVRTGRIAKAQQPHFAKLHAADPEGTEALLAELPPGVAVPLTEVGHAGEPDIDHEAAELATSFAKITGSPWKDSDR
ncbi:head maturation protease, ClpP-related [Nocardia terpenica]|uniref:ATP-dependent Clp protease proteolytic subunit n=1 Tax=Nocardia terpenica TaxID=455432 RepID=A0A164JVN2_9NOCA|nr:head maturation protease, ClpP-related [Nocardia terpenica]KZM70765.1 hypothetical protein AWN90_40100 [Nocardia terpenica]NQE89970.1 hypothetical protein [Nocardia terpenica]